MHSTTNGAISTTQEILASIESLWKGIENGTRADDFSKALLSQKIHDALTNHSLAPFARKWVEDMNDRFTAKYGMP